jgi:hypothetical protein
LLSAVAALAVLVAHTQQVADQEGAEVEVVVGMFLRLLLRI